jgi:predicted MFS family arabinose efflux permease
MVLECDLAEERAKVQSLNDFIVFVAMALGSLASGGLIAVYGWNTVLYVSFIHLTLAIGALAFRSRLRLTLPTRHN